MNTEATATIAWETRGTTLLASVLIDRFASRGFTAKLSSDLHSFRVCMVYGFILAWLESGARPVQACPVLATEFFNFILFFFRFIKNICRFFFCKNVILSPVHPAEGRYRRMNRRQVHCRKHTARSSGERLL